MIVEPVELHPKQTEVKLRENKHDATKEIKKINSKNQNIVLNPETFLFKMF